MSIEATAGRETVTWTVTPIGDGEWVLRDHDGQWVDSCYLTGALALLARAQGILRAREWEVLKVEPLSDPDSYAIRATRSS
jgi:hypothetical protein